jgi:hypothetical protein
MLVPAPHFLSDHRTISGPNPLIDTFCADFFSKNQALISGFHQWISSYSKKMNQQCRSKQLFSIDRSLMPLNILNNKINLRVLILK